MAGTSHGSGRGFASMDREKQRDIARKGGRAVSQDRQHMADIGRKGGQEVSQDTAHMSEIGRKGGEASHGGRRSSGSSPLSNPGRPNPQDE